MKWSSLPDVFGGSMSRVSRCLGKTKSRIVFLLTYYAQGANNENNEQFTTGLYKVIMP